MGWDREGRIGDGVGRKGEERAEKEREGRMKVRLTEGRREGRMDRKFCPRAR